MQRHSSGGGGGGAGCLHTHQNKGIEMNKNKKNSMKLKLMTLSYIVLDLLKYTISVKNLLALLGWFVLFFAHSFASFHFRCCLRQHQCVPSGWLAMLSNKQKRSNAMHSGSFFIITWKIHQDCHSEMNINNKNTIKKRTLTSQYIEQKTTRHNKQDVVLCSLFL